MRKLVKPNGGYKERMTIWFWSKYIKRCLHSFQIVLEYKAQCIFFSGRPEGGKNQHQIKQIKLNKVNIAYKFKNINKL